MGFPVPQNLGILQGKDTDLIRDWNALPDSLISSAEGVEDGVTKFTSLVGARD